MTPLCSFSFFRTPFQCYTRLFCPNVGSSNAMIPSRLFHTLDDYLTQEAGRHVSQELMLLTVVWDSHVHSRL